MLIYIKQNKEPVRIDGGKTVVITTEKDGFKVLVFIADQVDCSYTSHPLEAAMFIASEHLQGRDPDMTTVFRLAEEAQQLETRPGSGK